MKSLNKGFTLIELLVVIAIIGLLTSVVLASLNGARTKGADAAVKDHLSQLRSQMEMSYEGSYGAAPFKDKCPTIAGSADEIWDDTLIAKILKGISSNTSGGIDTGGKINSSFCASNSSTYAVFVPLKTTGKYACIDSSGTMETGYTVAKTMSTNPTDTTVIVCPTAP